MAEIKEKIAEFGFTMEDVFSAKKTRKLREASDPKYRDPDTGATWSGMGREPLWIKGRDRAAFAVENK